MSSNPELWESLQLKHQSFIEPRLKSLGNPLSEYCFSNLYLFRKVHNYRILKGDISFVKGITYDNCSYLMPLDKISEDSKDIFIEAARKVDFLFPICESDLRYFDPEIFEFIFNPDDSDYIYAAKKLRDYSGRQLAAKKNLMTQFMRNPNIVIENLSSRNLEDAFTVLNGWMKDVEKSISETDYESCNEALKNLNQLGLFGKILFSGNFPCGFVIAKENPPKTCVFHFAKGLRSNKGVYQFLFSAFAQAYSESFDFYNFEQDLGKANFRKTKRSYCPDQLLKKYRIKLKTRSVCF